MSFVFGSLWLGHIREMGQLKPSENCPVLVHCSSSVNLDSHLSVLSAKSRSSLCKNQAKF